jgi:RNA-binding protein YlmH
LTDRQVYLINKKFLNLSLTRKERLFITRKKDNIQRVEKEIQPFFSPKINPRSRDLDQGAMTDRQVPRTEIMYGYAEKYSQHKNELAEVYRDTKANEFKF